MQYEQPAIDQVIDLEGALSPHASGQNPRGSGKYPKPLG